MIFNKLNLAIVSLLNGDKYGAPHLNAVHVTDKATEVTNGHYIIIVERPDVSVKDTPRSKLHRPLKRAKVDLLISRESAKLVLASIPKTVSMPILAHTWLGANTKGDMAEFISTDLDTWRPIMVRTVEGKFPDSASLLKSNGVGRKRWRTNVWFDPGYMKKVCEAYLAAGVKAVKLSVKDEKSAFRFMARSPETSQLVTVLLMPIQGSDATIDKPKREKKAKDDGKPFTGVTEMKVVDPGADPAFDHEDDVDPEESPAPANEFGMETAEDKRARE